MKNQSRGKKWCGGQKNAESPKLTRLPHLPHLPQGKVQKKKLKKNLTSVSFINVCVAENGEMLVIFSFFFPTIV